MFLQFEMEIKKISDAYEGLVKHSQKRENLEKLMRLKLDSEMKKFKAVNHELKGTCVIFWWVYGKAVKDVNTLSVILKI